MSVTELQALRVQK